MATEDAGAHQNLLQDIADEMERNIHKKKEAELRIHDMRKAYKEARKTVHKHRLANIHAAEKDFASAKTARKVYHSGLKKIHTNYKPGGGTYGY